MEKEAEIQKIIGEQNVRVLRDAINEGRLKIEKIRVIAVKMNKKVYGTFDQKRRVKEDPVDVFNFMLETWYNEVLCEQGVDGYQKLVDILNHSDVAEKALALKMTPVKSQAVQIEMVEKLSGLSLASELQRDISASPETLTVNGNAAMWKLLVGGNPHSGCHGLYRRTTCSRGVQMFQIWIHI